MTGGGSEGVSREEIADVFVVAADAQLERQPFDEWEPAVAEQIAAAGAVVERLAGGVREDRMVFSANGHAAQNESQVDSVTVSLQGKLPSP